MLTKLLLLLFIGLSTCTIHSMSECNDFHEGNQAYFQQDYDRSLVHYEKCLENPTYALYSNLGSNYFKLGSLGKAHYYFLRAQELNPHHPNLKFNLSLIQELLVDQENQTFLAEASSRGLFESRFLFWLIFVSGLGFLLRRKIGKGLMVLGLLLSFGWTWYHWSNLFDRRIYGVVLEGKQVIYSNQNLHSSALTEVHAGKLLKIISAHEGWLRVLVKPDLQGWIPDNNLGKL